MPLEQEIITRRVLTYAKSWFDCTVCDRHTIQDEKTTFYRSNWNLTDLSLVHERRIIGSDEFLNVKSKHQLSIDSQININDRFQSIDLLQFKRCALHGVLCLWAFNAGFGFFLLLFWASSLREHRTRFLSCSLQCLSSLKTISRPANGHWM